MLSVSLHWLARSCLTDDPLEIELPGQAAPEPSFDGMEMSRLEDGSVEFAEPEAEDKGEA